MNCALCAQDDVAFLACVGQRGQPRKQLGSETVFGVFFLGCFQYTSDVFSRFCLCKGTSCNLTVTPKPTEGHSFSHFGLNGVLNVTPAGTGGVGPAPRPPTSGTKRMPVHAEGSGSLSSGASEDERGRGGTSKHIQSRSKEKFQAVRLEQNKQGRVPSSGASVGLPRRASGRPASRSLTFSSRLAGLCQAGRSETRPGASG